MRVFKICLMAIGAIGILFIIALVVGYCLFALTPPIRGEMMQMIVTAEAAQSLDQKLEAFAAEIEEAVANEEEKEVTLTITGGEINSKLTEVKAEGKLPLEEALVNFGEGYLMIYAVIDVPGVAAKLGMKGRMEVTEDGPQVVVEDFDAGKLPLPHGVNDGIGKLLSILAVMEVPMDDLPLDVTEMEIGGGEITFKGMTKIAD